MKANVTTAEIFETARIEDLLPGDFPGVWGGYEVTVVMAGTQYRLRTDIGIRTPRAACVVHVRDGEATVEATAAKAEQP